MQIFAAFQYYLLQDPFGLKPLPIFAPQPMTTWGILDFINHLRCGLPWFGDDAADLISIDQDSGPAIRILAPFILGYLAVWLMFCVMGVGVQWALRLLEV